MNARQKAKRYKAERDRVFETFCRPQKFSPVPVAREELERIKYVSLVDGRFAFEENAKSVHARRLAYEFEKLVPQIMEIENREIGSVATVSLWVKKRR